MKDLLLQLYLAAFFILVFFQAGTIPLSGNDEDFLSPSRAGMVRASAAIAIMLHHLMQQLTTYGMAWKGPVSLFNDAGFLCTAVFFFFSGYGLLRSLQSKPGYLRGFLCRRLTAILIPFWTVNLILVLAEHFIYGYHMSTERIVSELLGLRLINGNGWFIIEIGCLYLAFWLFFTIFEDHRDAALLLVSAFCFGLMEYAFFRGHDPEGDGSGWFRGEWWHNSTITFVYGLLWARFRSPLEKFFRRHYAFLLILFTALSGVTFTAAFRAVRRYGYYLVFPGSYAGPEASLTFFAQAAACLSAITLLLLLMMKIRIGNSALQFIGSISLELFLIHGVFVDPVLIGLKRKPVLYCAAVFAVSILCAFILSRVTHPLVRASQNIPGYIFGGGGFTQGTLEAAAAQRRRRRRIRMAQRTLLIAAIPAALCCIYFYAGNTIFAKHRYTQQCDALKNCRASDEVVWGRYETDPIRPGKERLKWIVLRKEGDDILLITKEGIAGSSYHHKHEEVSWEKSDLKAMLDSEMFPGMFSRYEKEAMAGGITLLTADEAQKYFHSDQERELTVTAAARSRGTNTNSPSKHHYWDMKGYRTSWWWLRGKDGMETITAPIVTVDGTIEEDTKYVNKPGGAIRPVIRVHIP